MFEKIPAVLNALLFSKGKKSYFVRGLFLFVAISPVLVLAAFSYAKTSEQLTRFEISQKEFFAKLSATTVSEKISSFIDIDTSLAMNPLLVDAVTQGDREKALGALKGFSTLFPFIEKLSVADPSGIIVGSYPGTQGAKGTSRANREWYAGVMQTRRPYVSEVYQTSSEPRYDVVAIVIPILPPGSEAALSRNDKDVWKNLQGLLALQIRLDSFENTLKPMERGAGQIAYLVDQKGHTVYHPAFPAKNGSADLSGLPFMNSLLKGKSGVEVIFNATEKENDLVAYEPVAGFGWGAVVTQPVRQAFKDRDKALREVLFFYGALLALSVLLANLFLRILQIRTEGEKKLKNSYNLLQAIIEGTSDIVFVKNCDGRYIMINSIGVRMFRKSQKEIVGKTDSEIFPEEEARQFIENDQKAMSSGGLFDAEETISVQGRTVILHTVRALHRDHAWKVVGIIGVARDITERKRMEGEIQEAARLKTKFVSIATHELRSPLTALYESVSQVLDGLMGPVNDLQRQILEITRDNLRRMVSLTTEILDFQKFDAGKMPFTMKEEDLREAIQTVYQTMHSLAEQKGIRFLLQMPEKLPRLVFDRDKIVQVLVNFVNNAIKFTETGSITLSASQEANMIHVAVKDTGPGMSDEDLGKLFQPFGQVGSHKIRGTGLGLSICKEIVEGHHGRVWAESKLGEGTTMHFAFPIKERRQVP